MCLICNAILDENVTATATVTGTADVNVTGIDTEPVPRTLRIRITLALTATHFATVTLIPIRDPNLCASECAMVCTMLAFLFQY